MLLYGNVTLNGQPRRIPTRRRWIALLDILGMREWVKKTSVEEVAGTMDLALRDALTQSSVGTYKGAAFGPLVGHAMFSDAIFLYAPSDSWSAFAVLCQSVHMLMACALQRGVPLRGAVSVGELAIDPAVSLFAGDPIVDAYLSDRDSAYRGVGALVTTKALEHMQSQIDSLKPVWWYWVGADVVRRTAPRSGVLIWRGEQLLIHPFSARYTAGGSFSRAKHLEDMSAAFQLRGLPRDNPKVEEKEAQTRGLLEAVRDTHVDAPANSLQLAQEIGPELLALHAIGLV